MKQVLAIAALLIVSAGAWAQAPITVTDGVNGNVAVKAAATQPAVADKAHVVAISPNNTGLPVNLLSTVQKHAAASSGSVASLANVFTSNNTAGNSIVASFCNGNVNAPTAPITDTNSNTYIKAVHVINGSAIECDIWFAVNIAAGANTVTVTPGGTNASIASEVYELSGLIQWSPAQGDVSTSASGTSATASASAVAPFAPNAIFISAVGLGTAAQTITPGGTAPLIWTNDSGQQNPATPAGLFSFISMSQLVDDEQTITPTATFTSEPWAIAAAAFHSPIVPVGGTVRLTDGANIKQVDPCEANQTTPLSISQTANAQLLAGTTGKKIYICEFDIVTATAQNIALVEGTGSTCATGTAGVAGFGGATAATGYNLAANGGIVKGTGAHSIGQEGTAADNLCLFQSSTGQVSGGFSYVVQ